MIIVRWHWERNIITLEMALHNFGKGVYLFCWCYLCLYFGKLAAEISRLSLFVSDSGGLITAASYLKSDELAAIDSSSGGSFFRGSSSGC